MKEKPSDTMLLLYNLLLTGAALAGLPLLAALVLFSEKRRRTALQRLGVRPGPARLRRRIAAHHGGKPLWVHALSVGEVVSAIPLVAALKERFGNRSLVFSTSTQTGFEIASRKLAGTADLVFHFPYDLLFSVAATVRAVDPELVVLVESDIWPNFLSAMKKRGTPVALVNARLSDRSFAGYQRLRSFIRPLFLTFARICCQSRADAGRFAALGVPMDRIATTGSIKFDQPVRPMTLLERRQLRHAMKIPQQAPVVVAGSTHIGEEALLADAFCKLRRDFAGLVLIVAPRDPRRAAKVVQIFRAAGMTGATLSDAETAETAGSADVVVIDRIGILDRVYALADLAFVGGSLVERGGHNPLEPAAFGKPVLFGPDMRDFADIARHLLAAGGAVRVNGREDLQTAAATLLKNPPLARQTGAAALQVFNNHKGAVNRTVDILGDLI